MNTIQENIFDIQLRYIPLTNKGYYNKSTNSNYLCNRSKDLLIIYVMLLVEPLINESRFVPLNRTIRLGFNFINPMRTIVLLLDGKGTKSQMLVLYNHNLLPKRIKNEFSIGERLKKIVN